MDCRDHVLSGSRHSDRHASQLVRGGEEDHW
nr:MAG TPA: hypothetical protein [Caudoviricetes sp.]